MTEAERAEAYAKACSDFEKALTDMVNYSPSDSPPKMVTEYVVYTASSYMEDESLNMVTSYSWFCTGNMSQSHLFGLMEMGRRAIEHDLEER